jgi:hypothetical protein
MTEQELRALVREAISRHLSGASGGASHITTRAPVHPPIVAPSHHSSHGLFMVPDGSDGDGPCIIEPAVMCTHCGYCKSYGH